MELLSDVTLFKHRLWAFDYADRMERWSKGESLAPIRIDAEMHTSCNLKCGMCARRGSYYESMSDSDRQKSELSRGAWARIAEDSGKMGVKAWNISGLCEPMQKPDVTVPTMRMIKAYDMFGEMTTNGTLWNEKFVEDLVKMGWDSVCVSLDSSDKSIHDSLRGVPGTYNKVMNALDLFKRTKKRYQVSSPMITLNVVLNRRNHFDMENIVKLASDKGVEAVFVEPLIVFNDYCDGVKLRENEIYRFKNTMEGAQRLAKSLGIVLDVTAVSPEIERVVESNGPNLSEADVVKKFDDGLIRNTGEMKETLVKDARRFDGDILSIPCYYPWFNLMIRGNGTSVHCGEWREGEEDVKGKTLEQIWNGQRFNEIRDRVARGDLPAFCEKCRPNIVEDTRIVRKSVQEFRDLKFLRTKYMEFLEENKELKQELYRIKRAGLEDERCANCRHIKSLDKFNNSLTYRVFSALWNTGVERAYKKLSKKA